jgi:outer membrane protein OmpA-like peptidoglycan-associated protein
MVNVFRTLFLAAIVAVAGVIPASAQITIDGGGGLFHVERAQTLGHLNFAVTGYYDNNNFGSHGLDVDETTITGSLTVGLGERFEVAISVPTVNLERTGNMLIDPVFPNVRFFKNGETSISGMTDGVARAKYNFFQSESSNLDISLQVLATIPTGDEAAGLGSGTADVGFGLMIDKGYTDILWSFNVGYVNADHTDIGLDPYFTWGAGLEYFPVHDLDLAIIAEIGGYAWSNLRAWRDDSVQTTFGARYYVGDWGSLTAGYSSWTVGSEANYLYTVGIAVGRGLGRPKVAIVDVDGPTGPEQPTMVIVLESIHYAFDSAVLTDVAKEALAENAKKLLENPSDSFTIEGNTCSIGTKGYNYQLGLRRAISAKKFLMEQGIEADRMMILSNGEEKPRFDNGTREGREQNRRVDFTIGVK